MRRVERRNKFYVYALMRPWDDTLCYVGKGCGKRAYGHLKAKDHVNPHFQAILNKAARLCLPMPVFIIKKHLSEQEAFALEMQLN